MSSDGGIGVESVSTSGRSRARTARPDGGKGGHYLPTLRRAHSETGAIMTRNEVQAREVLERLINRHLNGWVGRSLPI
jgi:hypothetical protein